MNDFLMFLTKKMSIDNLNSVLSEARQNIFENFCFIWV